MNLGKLGVWYFFDAMSSEEAAESAQRIESLGYSTLWVPETTGKNPMVLSSWLLANTKELNIATGIANIYHREPGVSLAAQKSLCEQSNNRFILGLGVSHKPLVEGVRGLNYGPPVKTMRSYLEAMKNSPYTAISHDQEPITVIAALGPKMIELASELTQGAHPYFTSPEHTSMAREKLGIGPWLCVEQKVIFEEDATKAREAARQTARIYQRLPNYRNNWLRMGLSEEDIDSLSEKFIDTTFAWGNSEKIKERIKEHFDAGADHVCIQPVNPTLKSTELHWECLEELSR